jgi:hypothetical protein
MRDHGPPVRQQGLRNHFPDPFAGAGDDCGALILHRDVIAGNKVTKQSSSFDWIASLRSQ